MINLNKNLTSDFADGFFLSRLKHDLMCTFKAFVISSRKVGKNHYFFWLKHPLEPVTLMVSNMNWTILTVISFKVKINLLIVNIVNIFCVSLIIKIYKMRGNWTESCKHSLILSQTELYLAIGREREEKIYNYKTLTIKINQSVVERERQAVASPW